MIRTLVTFMLLRRLRRDAPEMFDGARAAASIRACLAEHQATLSG